MEILVSEFPIPEKSVNEKGHTKTHACKETPGARGKQRAYVSLVRTEMYEGPTCTFIPTRVVGWSSQGSVEGQEW